MKTILCYSQGNLELHIQDHKKLDTTSLVEAGYLIPGEYASYFHCNCGESTDAEVVWMDMPDGKPPRPIVRCECGIYSISPDKLRTWTVPFRPLIQRIGEAMGFKPPFSEAVPEIVWSFGRKMRREFYYVRGLDWGQDKTVKSFFMQYPTAVLIVPTDKLRKYIVALLPDNLCFSVESLGVMDESFQIHIDMTDIETEIRPLPDVKRKTVPRRGNRAANIEKLVHELEMHILTARDHVWETGNLLPRPTMQDLGKLAGLEKHDVTRCMQDDDAVKLRYLWKVANHIKLVQEWKG